MLRKKNKRLVLGREAAETDASLPRTFDMDGPGDLPHHPRVGHGPGYCGRKRRKIRVGIK